MKELMQKTIEILKEKVNKNLDVIRENQKVIKEILKEPVSDERSLKLKEHYDVNKALLTENNDCINIQLTLINFMDKYKNTMVFAQATGSKSHNGINSKDYFNLTINGEITFDERHPMFHDEDFFNKLMNYYQEREDYETCGKLVNVRKN